MRVGIVGAGLIGARRARVVAESGDARVTAVADVDVERARAVAAPSGARAGTAWEAVTGAEDVDVVIVATPHHLLAPVALVAVERGKHVLVEKPLGRTPDEVRRVVAAARARGVFVKGGFNHRHHPGIRRAWDLAREGRLGELLFVRARYGHGGRPGYERDWRGDSAMAGGGELLDQGIHLVDLARWFLGDIDEAMAMTATSFWPVAPLEDNAFVLLRAATGQVVSLHASWTQWKNLFSLEVFGSDGAVVVDGLGGSYGTERVTSMRRRPESGPPEETSVEFAGADASWTAEWREFTEAIREKREPLASGADGLAALEVVHAAYEASRRRAAVRVRELFP